MSINLLSIVDAAFIGLLAGWAGWLSFRGTVPLGFGADFLSTALTVGVMSAIVIGGEHAASAIGHEGRVRKALRRFLKAAAVGLALPMAAVVLFQLTSEWFDLSKHVPQILIRLLWWAVFAMVLAAARGIVLDDAKAACRAFMGLAPAIVLTGLAADTVLFAHGAWIFGFLAIGLAAAIGPVLSLELLKEAWLEENVVCGWPVQYRIETEEFLCGSGDECDLSLDEGPVQWFIIADRDGVHVLECVDDQPVQFVGGLYRYRAMVDGDVIKLGERCFVYRSRYSRSRDAIPEGI